MPLPEMSPAAIQAGMSTAPDGAIGHSRERQAGGKAQPPRSRSGDGIIQVAVDVNQSALLRDAGHLPNSYRHAFCALCPVWQNECDAMRGKSERLLLFRSVR